MQIQLQQTDWTQEQKNLTKAAIVYLLHQMMIPYVKVEDVNGLVTIETDAEFDMTEEDIFARIQAHQAELIAASERDTLSVESIKAQILEAGTPEQIDELLIELRSKM